MNDFDLCCPECARKIMLKGKMNSPAFMVCMGNEDFIGILCPSCRFEFYILEGDYDRLKEEERLHKAQTEAWLKSHVKVSGDAG